MKELKNYITPIHKSAERDYLDRMINEKTKCIKIAKKYDFDYWDGSRRTGYGGYKYIKGYWKGMAEQLIKDYKFVFASDEGKNVLLDLAKRCHEFVTTHDKQSATESAFLEGQRSVLIFIKNMVNKKE